MGSTNMPFQSFSRNAEVNAVILSCEPFSKRGLFALLLTVIYPGPYIFNHCSKNDDRLARIITAK